MFPDLDGVGQYVYDLWRNDYISNKVIELYDKALNSCKGDNGKLIFKYGNSSIIKSISFLNELLSQEKQDWKVQKTKLDNLTKKGEAAKATNKINETAEPAGPVAQDHSGPIEK